VPYQFAARARANSGSTGARKALRHAWAVAQLRGRDLSPATLAGWAAARSAAIERCPCPVSWTQHAADGVEYWLRPGVASM